MKPENHRAPDCLAFGIIAWKTATPNNLFIKIPGTRAGTNAIDECIFPSRSK
jgi:hypothetical protein